MEDEILKVADYALEQPGVSGYICVDGDGLCVAAKGQARQSMSGIIHQIVELASKIEEPTQGSKASGGKEIEPPVIKVELENYKMMIQSRDSYTTALISHRK